MRIRLGQNGARRPLAGFVNEDFADFVALAIEAGEDGFRGAYGDFVFAAATAVEHGDSGFHRIFLPRADIIISTAKSAVRLTSSITGLTSTTSMESMWPLSQIN